MGTSSTAQVAPGREPLQAHDPHQVGPYRVLGVLGAGGMGQVYLAAGPAGLAAVKVVHPGLALDAQFRARFAREVAAGRRVRGPWTAAVVDADPDAETPWLATEYVPGVALDRAVATAGPLPPDTVHALAAHLARALVTIHEAGLVHRDVKPANVLLAAQRPCLIDFGISRALDGTRMTSTGLTVGTPAFMSPEQADGADLGTASDLFSLGAVLVWAASGEGPFGVGTPVVLLRRILTTTPGLGALSGPLREAAAACLSRDPGARPTAAQLAERLPLPPAGPGWLPPAVAAHLPDPDRLAAAGPGVAPGGHPSRPLPARRAVSRRGLLLGFGAVALAGAGIGAAGLLGRGTTAPGPGGGDPAGGPATPDSGPARLRWTYPTRGEVLGVAAAGGSAFAAGTGSVLHAVDLATGAARWTHTLRGRPTRGPVVVDGSVLAYDGRALYAVDAADGQLRWEDEFARMLAAGEGIVVSRGLGEDVEYRATAADAVTGAVRWQVPLGDPALRGPGVVAAGRVHVGLRDSLVTLDAATGATLWERPAPDLRAVTTAGASVYCTAGTISGTDTVIAFDAASGQERWRRSTEERTGPLTAHEDMLYTSLGYDGGLCAWDAATGDTRWEREPQPLTSLLLRTAPVVDGDTCYVGGELFTPGDAAHRCTLFAHDAATGEPIWSVSLDADAGPEPPLAVADGAAVLGTTSALLGVR